MPFAWAAAETEVEVGCVISWRSSYLTATQAHTEKKLNGFENVFNL